MDHNIYLEENLVMIYQTSQGNKVVGWWKYFFNRNIIIPKRIYDI